MRILLLSFLCICFQILFAQTVSSDTMQGIALDPVTIVGAKKAFITGAGEYIQQKKLQQLNQPNVNNVLRTVPGVNIRDEEGFGLRPNIGLRGTPVNRSAKITVMEDGVLVAPAPYADPAAYYFPTFARMYAVEVLKGSSQIKYGPYTIGGAVNLISTPIPQQFKTFAQLSIGSFNTNQQRIWVGNSQHNFDYVFELNRIASNGFKQLDNGGNTGFDRRDVMAKLRWHTNATATVPQTLTLKVLSVTEEGNETYLGLTYDDYQKNPLRRYAATQKDKLDMKHEHASLTHTIMPLKNLSINTTAYYNHTFRDWSRANTMGGQSINAILNNPAAQQNAYLIMTGQANGNIEYQSAARTYYSKGIQLNTHYYFTTHTVKHTFQYGMRIHADEADRYATRSMYNMNNGVMLLTSSGVKGNQENQLRSANSFAGYFNYDIIYKALKLSAGIRYETIRLGLDNYGTTDTERIGTNVQAAQNNFNVVLPGIGFTYGIDKKMKLFGGVHKGFSPPGTPTPNNAVQAKPEVSVNYELGYNYSNNSLHIQLVGFVNDYNNILGSDNVSGGGAGTGNMFNAGKALIKGVELSVTYNMLAAFNKTNKVALPVSIAYTFTDARFKETFVNAGGDWGSGKINVNDVIPFITPHLLTTTVGIEHKKFDVSVVARYTGLTSIKPGQKATLLPDYNNSLADVNALAAFTIIDVSANYHINNWCSGLFTINNLTNNKAIVANLPQGYRPQMPFSVNAGLKVNL